MIIDEESQLSVLHHLLDEIEEIEFEHEMCKRLVQRLATCVEKNHIPTFEYFMEDDDPDMKSFIIDLVSDKYALSELWEKKHGVVVPAKDKDLSEGLSITVYRLKLRKVQQMIHTIQKQLSTIVDFQEMDKQLKILMALKEQEKQIAAVLGTVVNRL